MKRMLADVCPELINEWSQRNLPITPDSVTHGSIIAALQKLISVIITGSNSDIVLIAQEQLGNVGGKPYWSWYGFSSRVEWCCCFVSWCANECGYIESGTIPKYSVVDDGVVWFKNKDQWLDGSEEPEPGMIIFFDWADC